MKRIGLLGLLLTMASVTSAVGQDSLPSVKLIAGREAMDKALKLPSRAGVFRRGLPQGFGEAPTKFKLDDMDRYLPFRRPNTAGDNPPSNLRVEFTTYYVAANSHLKLVITIADHPEVLMHPDNPGMTSQMGRGTPGSFTGRKLQGQCWHIGNLGTATGVCYLIQQSGTAEVFADLQMNSLENGKYVMHSGPTEDQARDVESLAEAALKNAVAYRDRGFR